PFIHENDYPVMKWLLAQPLRKEHDGFIAKREAGQCNREFRSCRRRRHAGKGVRMIAAPEPTWSEAVANCDSARAHIAAAPDFPLLRIALASHGRGVAAARAGRWRK